MKKLPLLAACLLSITGVAAGSAMADQASPRHMDKIHVVRATTQPPSKGAADRFTGDVSVNRLFPGDDALKISGGYVSFAAKARTAWHSHPNGQMIIVTEGKGRVQQWGEPVIEIGLGDVVWFPPGIKHWHGAAPDSALTHISLADIVDGKSSDWMELVSDDQYNGK